MEQVQTIAQLFWRSLEHDLERCLIYRSGESWSSLSSVELCERVTALAGALDEAGIEPGDRVALVAENGPDWPVVDFATLTLGAVLVPVYPTLTAAQAAYVIADSGARIVFVQGGERLAGLREQGDVLPQVERFVQLGESDDDRAVSLDATLAAAAPLTVDQLRERSSAVSAGDLATLIYTSGTTGNPKGVMLTHGNLASNVSAALEVLDIGDGFTALSFLPLSHSFERTTDYAYFLRGVTIAYAESVQTVARDLLEIEPHCFVSVPRVYEKVMAKVRAAVAAGPPLKRRLFDWAERVGRRALPYRLRGEPPAGWQGVQLRLADALVFSKIRARLGGRFRYATSGGAPLARDLAEFFWAAGIEIYEGYGLSETSPVLTVNRPGEVKLGSVGRPIPGVELRIESDGEILARGPNIMRGYYNLPDDTAAALGTDGWFRTGDIGEIDDQGFLTITDRKKELIVNAYGKNVAPAPIENALKASPFIEQAVVVGDQRKFLAALLVPDFDTLAGWAEDRQLTAEPQQLISESRVRALFATEVESINEGLARYEQIQAWNLLGHELTIEGGELTPTQKVKRRVIRERFADLIDETYRAAEERGPAPTRPT